MAKDWALNKMEVEDFEIEGPKLIIPKKIMDSRGCFIETYKNDWFEYNVAPVNFVQDNQSHSISCGTLRGLHFQKGDLAQGKLVRCVYGEIFDVALDIRPNSPTFGKHISVILNSENCHQLWIPAGFAHGFYTLKDDCIVAYKVNEYYSPNHDAGIFYNDPSLNIKWPFNDREVIVSPKDAKLPLLSDCVL